MMGAGVWYPVGGFQQITSALEQRVRELGVHISTDLVWGKEEGEEGGGRGGMGRGGRAAGRGSSNERQ